MHPRLENISLPVPGRKNENCKLSYVEWGDSNNPNVVVCLHGLTRNGRDFDYLARQLSEEFRVICPDMPGRGRSAWLTNPEDYNNILYMQMLNDLFDRLNVEKMHWIGTSMGGILGMMMASTQPERLRSLVLNDIGAVISGRGLQRISGYVGRFRGFPNRFIAKIVLWFLLRPFGIRRRDHLQHFFDYSLMTLPSGRVSFAYDPAIADVFMTARGDDNYFHDIPLWELWENVTCPSFVIRGARSDVLVRETIAKMEAGHPDMEYHEVPRVGHAPTLMDDEEIYLIQNFLQHSGRKNPLPVTEHEEDAVEDDEVEA